MKDAEKYFFQIKKRIKKAQSCVLILDFDGTLSAIAPTPRQAFLEDSTRKILQKCLMSFPIAVASGRTLEDVKQKIKIQQINYAGNHGLSWEINKKKHSVKIPKKIMQRLDEAAKELKKILVNYPGAFLENKKISMAVHYRLIKKSNTKKFEKDFNNFILGHAYFGLDLIKNIKAFELRPKIYWTKSDFVKIFLRYSSHKQKKSPLPIYIGDDTTDEDVFSTIKNIISIRVGKNKKSSAAYYLKNQKRVDKFLSRLCQTAK